MSTQQPADGHDPNSQQQSRIAKFGAKANVFAQKIGKPINKFSNKLGAEAFFPASLDEEADKAARILRSFCIDGFEAPDPKEHHHGDHSKQKKSLQHIPPEVIRGAKGLAIFTVMRTGLHWSGAGGSGVIVQKLPNGQWSPPSGILLHTLGWGLVAGLDVYDCVAVINNDKGMEGFTRARATLGGEVSAAVGPLGGGRQLDSEVVKRQSPVWTYMKSKGLYVGVQIDGTVIAERDRENERFYGINGLRHARILAGDVQIPPGSMVQLWETLQAAEGESHDANKLPPPGVGAPGDYDVEPASHDKIQEHEKRFDPRDRVDQH
ncbi:hypothetical protein M409DRAFT_20742 [Zasmidium cellare ATCC 36951]|uniref:Ysc84 actin-binding domain-containing protein n=1 Tax=Zasmidium cellare ATCC 36951 TaxID=1080233 RepID=A0A6A6CNM4_ZASCE|nr:uncharacterized protein M409DRAFT_20742 [Zasmidium cellare ATCC 36951]KAF2168724.1 hypothetical protein M409DRAFT_20742 [Zasmidium cellare ATCC 36951]